MTVTASQRRKHSLRIFLGHICNSDPADVLFIINRSQKSEVLKLISNPMLQTKAALNSIWLVLSLCTLKSEVVRCFSIGRGILQVKEIFYLCIKLQTMSHVWGAHLIDVFSFLWLKRNVGTGWMHHVHKMFLVCMKHMWKLKPVIKSHGMLLLCQADFMVLRSQLYCLISVFTVCLSFVLSAPEMHCSLHAAGLRYRSQTCLIHPWSVETDLR